MDQKEIISDRDVAIIGIGFRLPSGNLNKSLSQQNELFNSLLNGFDGTVLTNERWSDSFSVSGEIVSKYAGLLPLDEWKLFDPIMFGINPSDAVNIDPQQRLLLKCTWEALEDSSIDPLTSIRGSNTSVFIGCSSTDYCQSNKQPNETQINIFASTSNTISNRISYCFDLRSESMTIDTACSSSLNAINLGYNSIVNSKSSLSIVGGCNLILDSHVSKSFSQLNILSKSGKCQTFSKEADGFVRAECLGVVILKSLKDAVKDGNNIYCVIKGCSSNVDGNSNDKVNFYSPSKSSQAENIIKALKSTNGQVKASDIDYCECHGTGTPTGDPIECEGISIALNTSERSISTSSSGDSNNPLLIGSIKSNIGHGEASSGLASIIKCCVMFKHKVILPNINFKTPNPNIKFQEWNLKVVTEPIFEKFNQNKPVYMIINNFGVTGSNCSIILKEYNNNNDNNSSNNNNNSYNNNKKFIIPFSANSSKSLSSYLEQVKNISSNIEFSEFVRNQIKFKSNSLFQKSVIIASNWDEFNNSRNQIETLNQSKVSNITVSSGINKTVVVFVFCGQGSQYNKMALSLYENEEIFRNNVDKFDNELFKYYGYSVLDKLRSIDDNDMISIHQPILAQPINTMIQVSLYELYKHWGIKADIIVGHSLGEVSSSYCSGMIDFQTLCYLIYYRSIAQDKTTGTGRMLSINISPEEYNLTYSSKYPSIEIACYNSPSSIVIAGFENLLNEISKDLKSKGIFCSMLGSLSSFHTSSQLMIKDEVYALNIKSIPSKTPVFSTVTTQLFNDDNSIAPTTIFNSEYVFQNILKAVNFTSTISNIYKYIEDNNMGNQVVFIEIAPHPTLQYYLNQMKPQQSKYFNNGDNVTVYSPLHKKRNDHIEFLNTISKLYCQNGYSNINFKGQFRKSIIGSQMKSVSLPLYQFDDQQYWKECLFFSNIQRNGPSIDNLGYLNNNSPFKSYQSFIDIQKPVYSWLKGHSVSGGKYYMPGCSYIHNLLQIYTNKDITIDSMEFKAPLVLQDGINQCLQTNIYQVSKNEFKVQNHFKDSKTDQWVLASIGNFSLFKHGNEVEKFDIQQLKNQCNFTKLTKNEIYQALKLNTGINYNGLFRGVKESYLGDGCSFSIISINEIKNQIEFNHLLSNKSMNKFLNIPIIDSCLHGLIGLLKESSILLFDKIEGFKYYSSNIPLDGHSINEIYVFATLYPKVNNYSLEGLIQVMLSDGTKLFEISRVYCKSLTPMISNSSISAPSPNEIYIPYLQSKDSLLLNPTDFRYIYEKEEYQVEEDQEFISKFRKVFIKHLYNNVSNRRREINKELLKSITFEEYYQQFYIDQQNIHFFKFIYECLKGYQDINEEIELNIDSKLDYYNILNKSSRIMSKQMFPLESDDPNTDLAQSLFEDGLIESIYKNSESLVVFNNMLSKVVIEAIRSLLFKPIVFRIIEMGAGVGSLSLALLESINQLLNENPSNQINIEYTFSDVSTAFISEAKKKFSHLTDNNNSLHILYRTVDLDQSLIGSQHLNPNYYDMVLMSNVLHVVKNIRSCLYQVFKILNPNGQLIILEPPYKSIYNDSIFGNFSQWWSFEDTDIRSDRCTMNQSSWYKVLDLCNFKDTIMSKESENLISLIQTRKPSINELLNQTQQQQLQNQDSSKNSLNYLSTFNNIIIISNNQDFDSTIESGIIKIFKSSELSSKIVILNNYKSFNQYIQSLSSTNIKDLKILLLFIKSLDSLNINNYKDITLEYIQINQLILELGLESNIDNVLLSKDSTSVNYLASSLIGAVRYFVEFPKFNTFSIDLDSKSLNNLQNLLIKIDWLIDVNNNIQREFIIKDNQVYFERYKKESKFSCNNSIFKSTSFENNKDNLQIQLDSNLHYQLKSKVNKLKLNQVEIQVKSTGINYKDYLIYTGIVQVNCNDEDDTPNIGFDFSGIVTRSNAKKFNTGDHVFGIAPKASGSHVIADKDFIYKMPPNLDFSNAAAIPSVYITSLHSLYSIGNLQSNNSILIHSATGGVGLSVLEILKFKKHQGYIFVTVGSKDKEQYLKDKYGTFISGIYSSRDKNFVYSIKNRLKELNNNNKVKQQNQFGIDLILNTLSSEYMDSNFQCLNSMGRIVDLSITHITPNDHMSNKYFKFNLGYHNIELTFLNKKLFKSYLLKISKLFESNELNSIPTIQFSNQQVKEAIQFINERKHIGKIIVNQDTDIISSLLNINSNNIILKSSYDISKLNFGRNILITGQTGIILEICRWLVKYSNESIDNIIILSKSTLKWELELLINENKDKINFHFRKVDVSNSNEIIDVLNQLAGECGIKDINSVIHFAFNFDSCKIEEMNMDHINISHNAKVIGAINLHNESIQRKWNIQQFILASSGVSVVGSDQQCSYVSACCVIDSLSKFRKSILGLPSLSINLGAINSVGYVARSDSISTLFQSSNFKLMSPKSVINSLDLFCQNTDQFSNYCLNDFNFEGFSLNNHLYSKFDYEVNNVIKSRKIISDSLYEQEDIEEIVFSKFLNKVSELLSIDYSKINTDYRLLDYGLDSLVLVNLKNYLDKEFGHIITIQQLQNNKISQNIDIIIQYIKKDNSNNNNYDYKSSTTAIASQSTSEKAINNLTTTESIHEFINNEIKLDSSIKSKPYSFNQIFNNNKKSLLLTGSTGFLGIYLLANLLKNESCSKVYCLLRNKSNSLNPIDEILNNLKKHQLYQDLTKDQLNKIIAVVGDLSKENLGLSNSNYSTISKECDIVINSSGDLNLNSDYSSNKVVNVNGLKEIIKLSNYNSTQKLIVHFSTIAVFINQSLDGKEFDESLILPEFNINSNGYIQSKVISEKLLIYAFKEKGIPSIIIRPPEIWANQITGIGHQTDFVQLMCQASAIIGYYPNIYNHFYCTTITTLANSTINLILNEKSWSNNKVSIFNLNGPPIDSYKFYNVLSKEFKCKELDFQHWKQLVLSNQHKSCKKYSTIHNYSESFFLDNKIDKALTMSNSTKQLLKNINGYDYNFNDWTINESIILQNIKNNI